MRKNEEKFFKEMLLISSDKNKLKEYEESLKNPAIRNAFIQRFEFFILSNFKNGDIKTFFKWVCLYERFKDSIAVFYTPGYLFHYYKGGTEMVKEMLNTIRGKSFGHITMNNWNDKIKELKKTGQMIQINASDVPWSMMKSDSIAFLLRNGVFFPFNNSDDNLQECIKMFKAGKLMLTHFIGKGRLAISDPLVLYDIISHPRFKKYINLNIGVVMKHCKCALNSKNINKLFEVIVNDENYLKILKDNKDVLEISEISKRFRIKDSYKLLLNLI